MRRVRALRSVAIVALLAGGPAAAQTDGPDVAHVEVVGVEYAYQGLPGSVPAGTSLGFRNDGAEVHELELYRINGGVDATLEELLGMDEAEVLSLVEQIGGGPLIAIPGMSAEQTIALDREGRYAIVCFIPQGLTAEILGSLPPDVGPEHLPPELQAAQPHVALGMVQEFFVGPADAAPSEGLESGATAVTDSPADDDA